MTMSLEDCRRFYAEEIRFAAGIESSALIEALARVPREKFLGPGPWEVGRLDPRAALGLSKMRMSYVQVDDPRSLYHNTVVAIDKAAEINNGQPSALACWIDALQIRPGERVYHLGCGVGYYTAIMAEMVGGKGAVVASEVSAQLSVRAKENLATYPNVTVFSGDGSSFDPGPCDAMLINAGATHPLPLWLDRLNDGGRLVLPLTMAIGPLIGAGVMARITRADDRFSAEIVTQIAIYSCSSGRDPEREAQLKVALTKGALMKMKWVRRDPHEQTDSCLIHGAGVCVSSSEPA